MMGKGMEMNGLSDHEYQVECKVERMTDRLDARYMRGELTEEEYRAEIKAIDAWANAQYDLQA